MSSETSRALSTELIRQLREGQFTAYLAGGCVRDLLLGVPPKDFDIATNATPAELTELFPDALQVGAHFGVVLVKRGEAHAEIATFRSDHDYVDGRHPGHVRFEKDAREDVQRRDFTINAMLMDPISGEILDYTGGRGDLACKVIRAIGDPARRFAEDHLRMLRAVRFAARLGFEIDGATMAAIREHHDQILRISAERVREELTRILVEGNSARGLRLLDEARLMGDILAEITAMKGVEQPPEFHPEGDVWTHTMLLMEEFDRLPSRTITLALGCLLHDVGKPATFERADRIRFNGHAAVGAAITRKILLRLKFSIDQIDRIDALVANHMRFGDVQHMRESTLKRFLRMEHFDEHLELHRIDCMACHRNLANYWFVKQKLEEFSHEHLRPQRLLNGNDLIEMGYQPGAAFTVILRAVEDAQLEGELHTRDQASDFVTSRFPVNVSEGAPE